MKYLALIVLTIFIAALIVNILNALLKDCIWFCNVLEMHYEPETQVFRNSVCSGICPRCNKQIKKCLTYGSTWISDVSKRRDNDKSSS